MAQEITPNLGLVIDTNLTATAKQNLRKLDAALAKSGLVVDDGVEVNTDGDIFLQPGIDSEDGGDIFIGTDEYPAGTIHMYGFELDLTNVSNVVGFTPTGITDSSIAASADIQQSKIQGLVSDLAGKQDMFAAGDLVSGTLGVLTVSDGLGKLVGGDATITISAASAVADGYLAALDFSFFAAKEESGVAAGLLSGHEMAYTHEDIAHTNRLDLDLVSGTNTGDEDTSSIKTKLGAASALADGYLTSADWSTFSGKQDALGFTPVNKAGDTMTGQLVLDNQGLVFNIADDYVGTPAEGTVWWNKDDHTLNVQSDIVGTSNQLGQENWLRAKNDEASTILEGSVVYIFGSNTARPTVKLAIATTSVTADRVIGIATADIPSGNLGIITTFGLVRHISTNVDGDGLTLVDGEPIYLSATTAGEWVKTKPHAPNHCVLVGQIVNAANGGAGNLFVSVDTGTHLQDLHDVNVETSLVSGNIIRYNGTIWQNSTALSTAETNITNLLTAQTDAKEPTGFVDPDNTIVTYNSTNRTITLTRLDAGLIYFYYKGGKASVASGWVSTAHGSTLDQKYFLTISLLGASSWATSFPGFDNGVFVAQCNYYTAYKFALRESHGLMPWQVWEHMHKNSGTYRNSGGAVTVGTFTLLSDTLAAVTPGLDSMVVTDEDLPSTIPALTEGTYTLMHIAAGEPVFTIGATRPYPVSGGNDLQYNAGGNGLTSITTTNRYINIYAMGLPVTADLESQAYRWLWITSQTLYTSAATAAAEDTRSFSWGTTFATLIPESVIYPRFTVRYNTTYSTATGKSRLEVGPDYIVGNRINQLSVSGVTPAAGPATRYSSTFSSGTWGGVAGAYTLSIPGATHSRGADPMISVREFISGTTYRVSLCEVDVDDSTGDVLLTSTENFTGKVVIL